MKYGMKKVAKVSKPAKKGNLLAKTPSKTMFKSKKKK